MARFTSGEVIGLDDYRSCACRGLSSFSSENPVSGSSGVHLLESRSCDLIENTLRFEALVLIVTVGSHAGLESNELDSALRFEDGLSWRALIFTGESKQNKRFKLLVTISGGHNLPGDLVVNESRLLRGTTEHVAHIFHRHD